MCGNLFGFLEGFVHFGEGLHLLTFWYYFWVIYIGVFDGFIRQLEKVLLTEILFCFHDWHRIFMVGKSEFADGFWLVFLGVQTILAFCHINIFKI